MNVSPKILVIGDGAIGIIISAVLIQKGYEVFMVAKNDKRAKKLSEKGVEISGACGNIKTKIPACGNVTQITKRPDLVFIATKAPDMPDIVKKLKPILPDESLVIPTHNGIVEEEIASIIGLDRTVGCVVNWGATRHSEKVFEMASSGVFVIGYIHKQQDQRLSDLESVLSNIVPVKITDNILSHLYSKLIINSSITAIEAICGLSFREILSQRFYRNISLQVIKEAIDVANAMELNVASFSGKINYYKLLKWNKISQHLFLMIIGFKYRRIKSSIRQSIERGKKTEVNYINGYISQKGQNMGVQTPVNDILKSMINEIETGKRTVSIENLKSRFNAKGYLLPG